MYDFDISHFFELNGISHNKGKYDYSRFVYGHSMKSANMLNALINLRGYKCEECGCYEWLNKPIPLEVHHCDGDHLNNALDNLKILCPNCHSLTDNFRNRNSFQKDKNNKISDDEFKDALLSSSNIRQSLIKLGLAPTGGNYKRAYIIASKYSIDIQ